jgi:hypothetical protein
MPVLNEHLDWHTLSKDPGIANAFRGTPVKTLLDPPNMLCRFITAESKKHGIRGNETFNSPWWLEWSTAAAEIHQWKAHNAQVKDVIRGRFAVTTKFSQELDSLVQIQLTKPVYCWKGIVKHQADAVRGVTYLGGGEQLYLPHLASDKDGLSSDVAQMHYFGFVASWT